MACPQMAQNAIKPEEIDAGAAQQERGRGQKMWNEAGEHAEKCAQGERSDPRSAGQAGQRLCWQFKDLSGRIAPQECVVVPMPMNQIESMRLQSADRGLRLRLGDVGKEIVELDTNLSNRNFAARQLSSTSYSKPSISIFKRSMEWWPFISISRVRPVQGRVSLPPAFSHVLEAVPPPIENVPTLEAAKPTGLKSRPSVFASAIVRAATGA